MVTVYELLKRDDGSVRGLGNSFDVSEAEAEKLAAAGTHMIEGRPVGAKPPAKSGKTKPDAAAEDEGVN